VYNHAAKPPIQPSADPSLMKYTKTNIEAIAYNIASTAQTQPSMSEPVDVSLPVPRV
jgi:hypothetical protein